MVMHQLTNSLLHIDIISVAFLCVCDRATNGAEAVHEESNKNTGDEIQ